TVIGATYFTEVTPSERATPVEPTATLFTPTTFEKKPGAERFTVTLIVSLVTTFEEIVIAPEPSPPFFAAYCWASVFAWAGSSGSACAPASAAASAVDWVSRSALYQE